MRRVAILIFCLVLANCAKVEKAPDDGGQVDLNQTPTAVPTVESEISLKSVTPQLQLNETQQKNLDESRPPKVREILESLQFRTADLT